MENKTDILDQPTIYSGTTSSRSITKGDTMNKQEIKEAISTLTNGDKRQAFELGYAINLVLTNKTLTEIMKDNPAQLARVAYELSE